MYNGGHVTCKLAVYDDWLAGAAAAVAVVLLRLLNGGDPHVLRGKCVHNAKSDYENLTLNNTYTAVCTHITCSRLEALYGAPGAIHTLSSTQDACRV